MNIEHLRPDEEEFFLLLGQSVSGGSSKWIKFSTIAEKLGIDEQRIKGIAARFYKGGDQRDGAYMLDFNLTEVLPLPRCDEIARSIQAKRRRKPDYFARAIATAKSNRWIAGLLLAALLTGWLIGVVGGIIAIFR